MSKLPKAPSAPKLPAYKLKAILKFPKEPVRPHVITYYERELITQLTPAILDKQLELAELLLDRLTFENKRAVFKAILEKKADANGFKKTKNNSYPNSKFFDDLRLINLERNYFAHYVIDYSEEAIELRDHQITLLEFRDKTTPRVYNEVDYMNLRGRIQNAAKTVSEMSRN